MGKQKRDAIYCVYLLTQNQNWWKGSCQGIKTVKNLTLVFVLQDSSEYIIRIFFVKFDKFQTLKVIVLRGGHFNWGQAVQLSASQHSPYLDFFDFPDLLRIFPWIVNVILIAWCWNVWGSPKHCPKLRNWHKNKQIVLFPVCAHQE